ncbi:MAG: preQ(1) synthase [bacterium]
MEQTKVLSGGYSGRQKEVRDLKITPELEVVENEYSDQDYMVEMKTEEFVSLCPKTGLPDFATIIIQYKPDQYLVEQKSLKFYLARYKDVGIFQEHATNKILEDFIRTTKPKWAKITTVWKVRGGIGTIVEREYSRAGSKE